MSTVPVHRLILTALVAVMICSSVQAQGPAAAPAPESGGDLPSAAAPAPLSPGLDCTNQLLNLSLCLTYVEQGSNLTVPEKGCCPSFASLVDNQPLCLCELLANSNTFGIQIDTTKALMLPSSCRVNTPSVSLCAAVGIPVASPTEISPSPATGFQPGGPLIPAGIAPGSAAGPSTTSTASTTSKAIIRMVILVGSLFIAAIF